LFFARRDSLRREHDLFRLPLAQEFRRDDWINYGLLLVAFVLHTKAMLLRGISLSIAR